MKIPWRRAWQPAAVFLPGESHGQRSLAGNSPWGRKESDRTGWLSTAPHSTAICKWEDQQSKWCSVTLGTEAQGRRFNGISPVLTAQKDWRSSSTVGRVSTFSLPLPFLFSSDLLNRLNEANLCWGVQSTLLSLPIQTLISSWDMSQSHPEIMFSQTSGHPEILSSWHTKLMIISSFCRIKN